MVSCIHLIRVSLESKEANDASSDAIYASNSKLVGLVLAEKNDA